MSFYVYMLKSVGSNSVTYVGYTSNLKKRISLHNSGKGAKFTRGRKWKLIFKEKCNSKSEAISREYYIKNNRKIRNKIKYNYLSELEKINLLYKSIKDKKLFVDKIKIKDKEFTYIFDEQYLYTANIGVEDERLKEMRELINFTN